MKVFDNFPVLFTDRLKLVEITQSNIFEYFRIFNNDRITQFYTMPTLSEVSQAKKCAEWLVNNYKQKKDISWWMHLRDFLYIRQVLI